MKVFLVHIVVGWNGYSYRDPHYFSLHHYVLVMAKGPKSAEKKALEALEEYVAYIEKASVTRVLDITELKCDGWLVLWKYDDKGKPVLISDVGALDNADYSKTGECEEGRS